MFLSDVLCLQYKAFYEEVLYVKNPKSEKKDCRYLESFV